ncbi:MAG: ATP synthase F1 subunit delta [Bryobacteraceae bacterium]|nr:ATP synthase F1 subunit delta [Bryobacteraceae bacterium]
MSLAVASRYSRALAEVVFAPQCPTKPEQVIADLDAVVAAMQASPELVRILRSPAVSLNAKRGLLEKLSARLGGSPVTTNLLKVVCDHGRITLLKEIRQSFQSVVDERHGVARAEVTTAQPMATEQKIQLEAALSRLSGKSILATYQQDDALIGGAVAKVGSLIYDGSVRGQLATLRRKLVNG